MRPLPCPGIKPPEIPITRAYRTVIVDPEKKRAWNRAYQKARYVPHPRKPKTLEEQVETQRQAAHLWCEANKVVLGTLPPITGKDQAAYNRERKILRKRELEYCVTNKIDISEEVKKWAERLRHSGESTGAWVAGAWVALRKPLEEQIETLRQAAHNWCKANKVVLGKLPKRRVNGWIVSEYNKERRHLLRKELEYCVSNKIDISKEVKEWVERSRHS